MIEPMEINLQSMQDILTAVSHDYKKALDLLTELVDETNDQESLSLIKFKARRFLKENGREI